MGGNSADFLLFDDTTSTADKQPFPEELNIDEECEYLQNHKHMKNFTMTGTCKLHLKRSVIHIHVHIFT